MLDFAAMSQEERRERPDPILFSEKHLAVLQAIVDGFDSSKEIAEHINAKTDYIKKRRTEIGEAMQSTGLGKDNIAKAVVFSVARGLISLDSVKALEPKKSLSDRQINILTWMAVGFTDQQILKQLSVNLYEVKNQKAGILDTLGAKSGYQAIAWAVVETIRRQQI